MHRTKLITKRRPIGFTGEVQTRLAKKKRNETKERKIDGFTRILFSSPFAKFFVKLPAHPVKTGQARRGFPAR
jgi:hypothetical protein